MKKYISIYSQMKEFDIVLNLLFSYLAIKKNKKVWAREEEIRMLILKVMNERNKAGDENDLLQMIL